MIPGANCLMMEGDPVWVLQGVLSRASFCRPPISGQKTWTVLSLHISNIFDKKRCIAKKLTFTIRAIMIGQHIDLVAGDFNGTAWRCSNRNNISTIQEAFADCALPTPPGPTPLWRPGPIPNNWADVCVFLEPPESDRYWKVRLHGAFSITRLTYFGTCTSSRSDLMTLRACFSSFLLFRGSLPSALTIHVAQHPSRTSRHGVKKKCVCVVYVVSILKKCSCH